MSPLDRQVGLSPAVELENRSVAATQSVNRYRLILPEAEMCEAVHRACPLLTFDATSQQSDAGTNARVLLRPLPRFLDCSLYARGCRQNSLTARLFQSSGGNCEPPLVTTTIRQNWLPGIERCSFACRRPHYDSEHYHLARTITGIAAAVMSVVNIVVLATLSLQHIERSRSMNWITTSSCSSSSASTYKRVGSKSAKHKIGRPSRRSGAPMLRSWCLLRSALVYMHLFFLIHCLGWLMPLIPAVGDSIACHADGSLRTGEPQISQGKSFFCVLNFMSIYASLTAVAVWSLVFDHHMLKQAQYLAQHLIHARPSSARSLACCWSCVRPTPGPSPGVTTRLIPPDGSPTESELAAKNQASTLDPGGPRGHASDEPGFRRYALHREPLLSSQEPINLVHSKKTGSFVPLSDENPLGQTAYETTVATVEPNPPIPVPPSRRAVDSKPLLHELLEACLTTSFARSDHVSARHRVPRATVDCENPPVAVHHPGSPRRSRSGSSQSACLHVLAFAPSLTLTLISLTASEIDGDSLTGICVVGRVNIWARLALIVFPSLAFLALKLVYTSRLTGLAHHVYRRLAESPFVIDQEFAKRVKRCSYSHVGIALILVVCWLLSVAVSTYAYVREPVWLESQRSLILCQLSYRLLGSDPQSAHFACVNTPFTSPGTHWFHSNYVSRVREPRHTLNDSLLDASPVELDPDRNNAQHQQQQQLWTSVVMTKPVIGPIMLQLITCFILNAISASACLCDRSVKQCWRAFWSKLRCRRHTVSSAGTSSPPSAADSKPSQDSLGDLISMHFHHFYLGYAWWDPGLFTPPIVSPQLWVHNDGSLQMVEKPPPSPLDSIHVIEPIVETPGPTRAALQANFGTSNEDIVAQLERLIDVYRCSAYPNPALPLFLRMREQLLAGAGGAGPTCHDVSAQLHGLPASHQAAIDPGSQSEQLFASVAALCDQLGKQLSGSTQTTSVRRGRHRRLLTTKNFGRRRVNSRSLSTNELSSEPFHLGQSASGPSSIVSRPASDVPPPHQQLLRQTEAPPKSPASLLKAAAASLFGSQNPVPTTRSTQLSSNSCFAANDSLCGVSQMSINSALTRIASAIPPTESLFGVPRKTSGLVSMAPSTSRRSLPRDAASLGSRMSLRSMSGTSSSGAESYNSHRLLLSQAGAGWRELWRTRMLLMDVLRWAEAVAPFVESSCSQQQPENWPAPDQQTNPADNTGARSDWGQQFVDLVSLLMSNQHRSEGLLPSATAERPHVTQTPRSAAPLDPMMAAALAAATAAATVAMQQQQQQQKLGQPEATAIHSPTGFNQFGSQKFAAPAAAAAAASPLGASPDFPPPSADHHPLYHYIDPVTWASPHAHAVHPPNPVLGFPPYLTPTRHAPAGFRGQPDLLMDHDRSRLLLAATQGLSPPNHSPVPLLIHRPPAASQLPVCRESVEHRAAVFVGCSPGAVRVNPGPRLPETYTFPTAQPIYIPPPTIPVIEPARHSLPGDKDPHTPNRSDDDSDAFNSEDEIVSEGECDDVDDESASCKGPVYDFPVVVDYPGALDQTTNSSAADDCDVSSVSRSASQVVAPRDSPVVEDVDAKVPDPPPPPPCAFPFSTPNRPAF